MDCKPSLLLLLLLIHSSIFALHKMVAHKSFPVG
jgi:hypothetical protein